MGNLVQNHILPLPKLQVEWLYQMGFILLTSGGILELGFWIFMLWMTLSFYLRYDSLYGNLLLRSNKLLDCSLIHFLHFTLGIISTCKIVLYISLKITPSIIDSCHRKYRKFVFHLMQLFVLVMMCIYLDNNVNQSHGNYISSCFDNNLGFE